VNRRNQSARLDPFSYAMAVAAGLISAALTNALGIGGAVKYLIAFAVLTLTVGALLARSVSPGRRFVDLLSLTLAYEPPGEEHRAERKARFGSAGFSLTRKALGLDLAEARSEERAARPRFWIPSAEAPRRVSFRTSGSSLVVGAEADEPEARIARVHFPQFRAVYVLLCDLDNGRAGEATVPNLARDFVDQVVTVEWLEGAAELPARDAEAIAASVAYANHAGKRAWLFVAEELSADDPVRAAIVAAAE
jgi:hypothetical protein